MKEYYFDSLPSKEDVISKINTDQNIYQKENNALYRPKLVLKDFIVLISFPTVLVLSIVIIISWKDIYKIVSIVLISIYIKYVLKYFCLVLIRFYQAFAPYSIRMKCCLNPSCSEYTYISIFKYGIIKGCIKGYHRIKRCNPKNAGVDNP